MTEQEATAKSRKIDSRQTLVGRVVSSKMKDTIVVSEERLVKHAVYGKYVRKKSRFVAHDAGNTAREGDEVEIMQTRPISKTKNWRLVRVVRRSEGGVLHADVDMSEVASPSAKTGDAKTGDAKPSAAKQAAPKPVEIKATKSDESKASDPKSARAKS